jgi:hypothetical protein
MQKFMHFWNEMAFQAHFHIYLFNMSGSFLHRRGKSKGFGPGTDATYMPELGGVLNKVYHNQYGQKRDLSECIVLRGSKIEAGKAYVPAGGLF